MDPFSMIIGALLATLLCGGVTFYYIPKVIDETKATELEGRHDLIQTLYNDGLLTKKGIKALAKDNESGAYYWKL